DGTDWQIETQLPYGGFSALSVFDGDLFLGGFFRVPSAVNIARLHEGSWIPCGTGTDGGAFGFSEYNGEMTVGGTFSEIGGVPLNHVARWDGHQWRNLGTGTNDAVLSLSTHEGHLIAGGTFTSAGGINANTIAEWNGSSWQGLGSGMAGTYPWVGALSS